MNFIFHVKPMWLGRVKLYSNGLGHMTKMATIGWHIVPLLLVVAWLNFIDNIEDSSYALKHLVCQAIYIYTSLIALSAHLSTMSVLPCAKCGVNNLLQKPTTSNNPLPVDLELVRKHLGDL